MPVLFYERIFFNNKLRLVSRITMLVSFTIVFFANIRGIQSGFVDSRNFSYFAYTDLLSSFLQIFTSYDEAVVIYEIYNPNFTKGEFSRFKKNVWEIATYQLIIYAVIGNATFLAFGPYTDENILNQFPNRNPAIVIAKVCFMISAFGFIGIIYSPIQVVIKEWFGFFSTTNKIAKLKLDSMTYS